MKKFFLFAAALMTGSAVMADTESYVAAIDASTMASVFPVGDITGSTSEVSFGTANMDVLAVGGSTPKTILADGTVTEWNAISWQPKNTNLQDVKDGLETPYFFYVLGTGNPCVDMGVEEIIRDGENGVIVPSKDADALFDAMLMIVRDKDKRVRMAGNARKMIADRYEQSFVRKCLYDFYDEILQNIS